MMTDTIADMLTRLRNANTRQAKKVSCPYSKIKEGIAEVLKREGFIESYNIRQREGKSFKEIEMELKYDEDGNRIIIQVRRESKPGCRIYKKVSEIQKVLNGFGIGVYSTSKGILSDRECRMKRVGGEYLCSVF